MWREEFVQLLDQSTVEHPLTDQAIDLKNRNLPNLLYKYRQDCKYSRDCLLSDKVWLSSPEAYNDPYDCAVKFTDGIIQYSLERAFAETLLAHPMCALLNANDALSVRSSSSPLRTLAKLRAGLKPPTNGDDPEQMAEFLTVHVMPKYVADISCFFRSAQNAVKLCSFCEIADSMLMWCHYADDHKGFCIEYEVGALPAGDPFVHKLFPVIYSDKLFDFTRYVGDLVANPRSQLNLGFPLLGVLHKDICWNYEKEWRFVFFPGAIVPDHLVSAPRARAVILGRKMSDSNRGEVVAICRKKGIEVRQSITDSDSFLLTSEVIR
jgi:hypothetical protein